MRAILSRILPQDLKSLLADSAIYDKYMAKNYAKGLKRLDICATEVATWLSQANINSLEGKVCLEVGCGWNLTHALVYHLLGAQKIIATDIAPHVQPSAIKTSIHSSIDSVVRDNLAPFSSHASIRERLDNLKSISSFSLETLQHLGIFYESPIDLATDSIDQSVDHIFSVSVLEHVPVDDVGDLLTMLYETLNSGGEMVHSIHLEDHRDFSKPFDFLAIPSAEYGRERQTSRGNRLRESKWRDHLDQLPGADIRIWKSFQRLDKPLPDNIDKGISYIDESDLRTSHLGIFCRKGV